MTRTIINSDATATIWIQRLFASGLSEKKPWPLIAGDNRHI